MPILNFKKQFADAVKNRNKQQTIRAKRKIPIKIGDKLFLYTGLRTKQAQKLLEVTCTCIEPITITESSIILDGYKLNEKQIVNLAVNDGFNSFDELKRWFEQVHGLPFNGNLIAWW